MLTDNSKSSNIKTDREYINRKGGDWMEKQFIKVKELCQILGLERNTVYRSIKRGEIPTQRIGGMLLIPKSYLEKIQKIV